ncbi:MAG: hypothetical protein KAU29_11590, partial [Gammaproteobacteria bacterium]|nr:hypothetical protein [Gammaproteobacteria bacterium]
VLILLAYTLFYIYRTENHSGGGADIGMGLVMLTMPISLLIGITISALLGEYAGSRFREN